MSKVETTPFTVSVSDPQSAAFPIVVLAELPGYVTVTTAEPGVGMFIVISGIRASVSITVVSH